MEGRTGTAMAVAVKNTPEVDSASLLDRMPVAALAGTAYVLGTLGIVFYLLPSLWQITGWGGAVALVVRGLLQLAALAALLVFGVRLLGPKAATGVRAGIFVGLVGFLLILLLTRWASVWIEYLSFERGLFSASVGAILTVAVGVVLLALAGRLFLRDRTERFLVSLEEQGWFSAKSYKALQGMRVRRGTIFGILLLVGAGIWTMLSHATLRKGSPDWQLNVPFTGRVIVDNPGDVKDELNERFPGKDLTPSSISDPASYVLNPSAFVKVEKVNDARDLQAGQVVPRSLFEQTVQRLTAAKKTPPTGETPNLLVLDRHELKEINRTKSPSNFVKIIEPGSSKFQADEIVPRSQFDETVKEIKKENGIEPQAGAPQGASGPLTYRTLTLLPSVQFTVPLLMLAAALWLAWRVVNVPAFADFLIATEAEMNKVSWTTQRRLIQDTIVVLVTVVLMAFYLFSMDVIWKSILSWHPIGVLQIESKQLEATQPVEDRPW
jgi:preprotein translocase SecE subunit